MSPGYGSKIYKDRKFPLLTVIFLIILAAMVFFMLLPRQSKSVPAGIERSLENPAPDLTRVPASQLKSLPDHLPAEPAEDSGERTGHQAAVLSDSLTVGASENDRTLRLQARRFFEKHDFRGALSSLQRLSFPGYPDIRDQGLCHYYLEEYAPALARLGESVAARNEDPVALKFLAFTHYKMDNLEESLNLIERALEIETQPELAAFRNRLNRELEAMKGYTDRQTARFKIIFSRFEHGDIRHLVADILNSATREIGRKMGYYPRQAVTVILYNEKAFFDITRAPAWVGGLYDGKIRIPIKGVEGQENLLKRVLFHEYTHALIRDITPSCPLWIHEGLAEYFSTENQARIGQVFPLNQLEERFPSGNPLNVILAYRESYSAVWELISRSGLYRIKDLLEALAGGESFGSAFESVYMISYQAFLDSWGRQ